MIKKSLLALAPILAAVMPMTGMAAEGTVGFEGHITQTTCVVEKYYENLEVDLGKYPTEWFPEVDSEGTPVLFDIAMTGCPYSLLQPVLYGATVPSNTELLKVSQAGNIGIAIYDNQYRTIAINAKGGNHLDFYSDEGGGMSVVYLYAVYRSYAKPVTPGRADATVTFSIEYP